MPLKKQHKIIIGSFSSFLVIVLIANSLFIYFLYGQLQYSYNKLESEIQESQVEYNAKLNDLTESQLKTNKELQSLGSQIGDIGKQFDQLKASTSADFSGIIEDVVKSVVTIKTDVGQGTGFIITSDGYVVTNAHVLTGANALSVTTYEQDATSADFIGYNSDFDVALLKISGNYERLRLENSGNIQIGEKVIAIGNPLGLQFSVSEGIVSAIHREGPNGVDAYIQTDAALNPGNSGGPLINKEGKVIGINNYKISSGESLGFALESNYIEGAVNEIANQALGAELI